MKIKHLIFILLLVLLLAPIASFASVVSSPSSDGGATCSGHPCTLAVTCPTSSCAATDIQTAVNQAIGGDTITIQAGKIYTSAGNITLKSGMASTVTVRTSTSDSLLPDSSTRITPVYSALVPNIQLTSSSNSLFRIEQSISQTKNYSFIGIEFSSAQNIDSTSNLFETWYVPQDAGIGITNVNEGPPIVLTMTSTTGLSNGDHVIVAGIKGTTGANGWWTISNVTGTTVQLSGSDVRTYGGNPAANPYISKNYIYDASMMPDHISFDRCLFIGAPLSGIRQGVRLAGTNLTVKNSYCDGIKAQNDSQCISMPTTPGPVTITNNFLSAAGENIITGGAISNLPGPDGTGQNVTDLTITNNVLYKDPAEFKYEAWSANMWVRQGKAIDGGNGLRYIAMTNGTTGSTIPAFPTTLGPSVVDGTVTWQRYYFTNSAKWNTKNILEFKNADRATVKWNTFDGNWADAQSGNPLLINGGAQGYIGLAKSQHIEYGYNVIRHTPMFFSANSGQDYGDGILADINLHDNLVIDQQPNSDTSNPTFQFSAPQVVPPYVTGLSLSHNTVNRGNVSTFFKFINAYANGSGKFDAPVFTNNLFNVTGASYVWGCSTCLLSGAKNVLDGITTGLGVYTFSKNVLPGENLGTYPTGNFNTVWNSIGFTDIANRDYSLTAGSAYHNAGTDGKDLGADTTQLPQIHNLVIAINGANTRATLSWNVTTSQQNISCVTEVSPDASFSTYVPDLDPTLSTRPDVASGTGTLARSITIGTHVALTPNANYAYRLHCGGAFEYGSFTTSAVQATAYTMTGPTSGALNATSGNFTVSPVGGVFTGNIIITPSGAGSIGLAPINLTFENSNIAQTFTIVPTSAGSITLTPSNSGTLTNPNNLTYTSIAPFTSATYAGGTFGMCTFR